MFIGHYGVAFALRAIDRRSRLWEQFLAVQALDVIWAVLVLLGVERFHNVPGQPWPQAQQLDFVPWSHSLVAVAVWCAVAFVVYRRWRGPGSNVTAWLIALAVLSHWVLDLVVHPGDVPLYDNSAKVGFGLWDLRLAPWVAGALVTLGAVMYLRTPACRSRIWTVVFLVVLLGANAWFFLLPPPASVMLQSSSLWRRTCSLRSPRSSSSEKAPKAFPDSRLGNSTHRSQSEQASD